MPHHALRCTTQGGAIHPMKTLHAVLAAGLAFAGVTAGVASGRALWGGVGLLLTGRTVEGRVVRVDAVCPGFGDGCVEFFYADQRGGGGGVSAWPSLDAPGARVDVVVGGGETPDAMLRVHLWVRVWLLGVGLGWACLALLRGARREWRAAVTSGNT